MGTFLNQKRIRQRKERDGLRLSHGVPTIQAHRPYSQLAKGNLYLSKYVIPLQYVILFELKRKCKAQYPDQTVERVPSLNLHCLHNALKTRFLKAEDNVCSRQQRRQI